MRFCWSSQYLAQVDETFRSSLVAGLGFGSFVGLEALSSRGLWREASFRCEATLTRLSGEIQEQVDVPMQLVMVGGSRWISWREAAHRGGDRRLCARVTHHEAALRAGHP